MGNGEFDTTDANFTQLDLLKKELEAADRVNGALIRLCCQLYRLAWEAGVDPDLPEMKQAEENLRRHDCWNDTWDGTGQQSPASPDEGS
ncbi:MAG: hypothetical protein GWN58_22930 [Anaerolineae bacterium]|nr:hypothetical protein [Thermoplasmata archaeon]NIV32230.1 hypothetical protein [Anaerolineae bacterium]NIY03682.1 hypothetical protein [Thermoplasmata archaeon]